MTFQMLARHFKNFLVQFRAAFSTRDILLVSAYPLAIILSFTLVPFTSLGNTLYNGVPSSWHLLLEQQIPTIGLALIGFIILSVRRHRALSAREATLKHQAHFDLVTSILNRRGFLDTLAELHRNDARQPLTMLLFDLDGFKAVNDTHGHAAGDQLLRTIPHRVHHWLPNEAVFARLSGDEFAIVFPGDDTDTALSYARMLLTDLSHPFELDEKLAVISTSIGISLFPKHSDKLDDLVRKADVALYHSKRTGRNRITVYEASIDAQTSRRTSIGSTLRTAVESGEILPFYQPLIEVQTGALVGFEVLARWEHRTYGIIPPSEFIPLVAEMGLLAPFTETLLKTAMSEAVLWPTPARISFNIAPALFTHPDFVAMLCRTITSTGISPDRIDLELTEDMLITKPEAVNDAMFMLRGQGVTLSLDDFGVGYSSLSHLIDIPFDTIKLDRALVRRASICQRSRTLLISVIALGRSMGARVLAEGVETLAERDLIANLGCDLGQGWLYGRPKRIPDFYRAGVRSLSHLRTKSLL